MWMYEYLVVKQVIILWACAMDDSLVRSGISRLVCIFIFGCSCRPYTISLNNLQIINLGGFYEGGVLKRFPCVLCG